MFHYSEFNILQSALPDIATNFSPNEVHPSFHPGITTDHTPPSPNNNFQIFGTQLLSAKICGPKNEIINILWLNLSQVIK